VKANQYCKPDRLIKTLHFQPYMKGKGPRFTLRLYDTYLRDNRGQTYLAYTLKMGARNAVPGGDEILFTGQDFAGSPMHSDDSRETALALLNFLTLRPGDTDADYFKDYTKRQLWFCDTHAEALSMYGHDN
jgi:hypothetical protein